MTNTFDLVTKAQGGDEAACEQLIRENTALVWSIVRRFTYRGSDPDDLYQLGCMGLLKAVRGFDAKLGYRFSTYAVPKIAGEIRRFLRDDGMVKVSRSIKERAHQINRLRETLYQQSGREPTLSELSDASEFSVEEIAEIDCASVSPDSLNREATEDGSSLESLLGDNGIEEPVLERVALSDAIKQLPERERMVILSRFFKGLTQDKTAKLIGISQVQVSRLERAAIKKLRELL